MMRLVGYACVPLAERPGERLSLDAQESQIRAWADARGHLVVEVIREQGAVWAEPLADRPGGARIARLLEATRPSVDAVVVVRRDVLGRDAAEQVALLRRFRSTKTGLFVIAQNLDLATRHGRARDRVSSLLGRLEGAVLTGRIVEGVTHRPTGGSPI